jgi:hypothetical protein
LLFRQGVAGLGVAFAGESIDRNVSVRVGGSDFYGERRDSRGDGQRGWEEAIGDALHRVSLILGHHPTVATGKIHVGRRLFQHHGGGGGWN